MRSRTRFAAVAAALFAIVWLALALQPRYRQDWALENTLTVVAVIVLAVTHRRRPLSRVSYALVGVFLTLHALGAHYTYSEVPYDAWGRALTGQSLDRLLGWQRNNYDRVVHLCFGLLLVLPARELFGAATGTRGFWSYALTFAILLSLSASYELIEWGAALVFGGDLGIAYVGAQGDVWDAQKDMCLAALGALVSSLAIALTKAWRRPSSVATPHAS